MRIKRAALMDLRILLLAIGMTIAFMGLASAYNLEDYHPLGEGSSWIYLATINREGKVESYSRILKITGKEIIGGVEAARLIYSDDESECLVADTEGVKRYKFFSEDTYEIFKPSMMLYPANLSIGETKEYTFNSEKVWHKIGNVEDIESQASFEGTMLITLEAIEDIVVDAGSFTGCLKFSSVYNSKGTEIYAEEKYTSWLAPGVGLVKEICDVIEFDRDEQEEEKFTESFELISASIDGKDINE
ncbi:MAG: hypothetical protein ISS47_03775 [Candidatus Omnitrophica bacterium]|nr:hypothetical protein [Candidatus Omnitrophota bacterium]